MEKIVLTPKWKGVLPILTRALQIGTHEGKCAVEVELGRMADAADRYNEKVDDAREGVPYL